MILGLGCVVRLASCIQGPLGALHLVASYLQQLASKIPTKLGERAEEAKIQALWKWQISTPPIFQW